MSDLTKTFDVSRQTPSGQSLEQLRQNYFIQASMDGSDENSIGGININTNGRKSAALLAKQKQQQATNDIIMLANLQRQLEAIENNMIDKYGEDFAEQFAAEYLDETVFNDIMKIDDDQQRRAAFAQAINGGIKNGTIDAKDVYGNPDFTEWLTQHKDIRTVENEMKIAQSQIIEQSVETPFDMTSENNASSELDNIFNFNNPFG